MSPFRIRRWRIKRGITTGSGNDVVTLSSSDFTGLVAVTTQGGDDQVTINSTGTAPTFGGIVSVQSGASSGTDTISVSGDFQQQPESQAGRW